MDAAVSSVTKYFQSSIFMAIHSTDGAAVRVPATHSSIRVLPSNQNPRSFTVTGFRLSTPLFTLRFL